MDTRFVASARACSLLLAFGVSGYLSGWFVGASSVPVVAAFLPLLIGVLGTLGITHAQAVAKLGKLESVLDKTPEEIALTVKSVVHGTASSAPPLPVIWPLGVILFCVPCYFGVLNGYDFREPVYPSLRQMLPDFLQSASLAAAQDATSGEPSAPPDPLQVAAFHAARWQLKRMGIPPADAREILADILDAGRRTGNDPSEALLVALQLFTEVPKLEGGLGPKYGAETVPDSGQHQGARYER